MAGPVFREESGFAILGPMTKLMEAAVEARALPDDVQDYLARAVLSVVRRAVEPIVTGPDERNFVIEGVTAVRRGDFATEQEIDAAFNHFDQ